MDWGIGFFLGAWFGITIAALIRMGEDMKTTEDYNELRAEILERNKKAKRITADYQREMEATWNRWEDSDERTISS